VARTTRCGLFLLLLVAPVVASPLSNAKQAGQVGEQADGYLGLVDADSSAVVEEVNTKRRAKYEKIAANTGAPLAAVAERAGVMLLERTEAGHYIRSASGEWSKK